MKKTTVLLFICLLFINKKEAFADTQIIYTRKRSEFSYEILNTKFIKDYLLIEGWAILPSRHHFIGDKTHSYHLVMETESKHKTKIYKSSNKNINLTKIMEYRGYPDCRNNAINQRYCNYKFKNVGFSFKIPLKDIERDSSYNLKLRINSKVTNQIYETPLYYPKDQVIQKNDSLDRRIIKVESHINKMKLNQYYHTLIVRTEASPNSDTLNLGKSCSKAYENISFFKENTNFNNILGLEKYKGLITYFKVNVKEDQCINQRKRVVEGGSNDHIAYLPSPYVNYFGDAMRITSKALKSKPKIIAEDKTIIQYQKFNPMFDTQAFDRYEGNITNKLKITKDNVNTRYPGKYNICYEVKNKDNLKAQQCININVIRADVRYRYINEHSLSDLFKKSKLWLISEFKRDLQHSLSIK